MTETRDPAILVSEDTMLPIIRAGRGQYRDDIAAGNLVPLRVGRRAHLMRRHGRETPQ
jgi:hypothetical protein